MDQSFALRYAEKRMCEIGVSDYYIRLRELRVRPGETIQMDGHNHLYLLTSPSSSIRIESAGGCFDRRDTKLNELSYEHRGKITITNRARSVRRIQFVQVIPTNKHQCHGSTH